MRSALFAANAARTALSVADLTVFPTGHYHMLVIVGHDGTTSSWRFRAVGVRSAVQTCVLGLGVALCACSVFEADRLKNPPARGGASGSGGLAGSVSGGAGGQNTGGVGGIGGASGGGGGGGMGVAGVDGGVPDPADGGDGTRCGDGLVTGMELCDTGIAAGDPGACPTECPPLAECVMRALNGTGCRAECIVLQAACTGGDGCCPGNCTPSNDSDCSALCGDGIVQVDEGETCEPEPAGDAGNAFRCPTTCDDENACTTDVMSGSVANCNVECTHVPITSLTAGDGCCPPGANASNDADCTPVCGNGVRERGEDCDGSPGCNAQCDLGYTMEQRRCLDTFAVTNDECAVCSCTACTQTKLDCLEDTVAARRERCVSLQACVRASGCFDSECYCGAPGCLTGIGPCRTQVEVAAETTNALLLNGRKMDLNFALGRSYALDVCIANSCASACD